MVKIQGMISRLTIKDICYMLVIAALLGIWLKQCQGAQKRCEDRITTERVDTVYRVKGVEFATFKRRVKKAGKPEIDSFRIDPLTIIDTALLSVYEDSAFQSGVGLQAHHLVQGKILQSDYKVTYPEISITKTNNVRTQTNQIFFSTSLMIGPNPDIATGLFYIHNNIYIGYEYNLRQRLHEIKIGKRIVSW